MATIYNLTNTTNSTNLYDVAIGINQASDGVALVTLIMIGWLITLIAMKGWETKEAFTASSFGFMVISVLMFGADLLPAIIPFFFAIMVSLSIVLLVIRQ